MTPQVTNANHMTNSSDIAARVEYLENELHSAKAFIRSFKESLATATIVIVFTVLYITMRCAMHA